ncbi:MAG TPA: DNA recombination protein RmuC [Anaeromyxobacteraceae bacterium]|nr:DNA recombination protein RmuC [Anaeromyxobacteraceae bacterium]
MTETWILIAAAAAVAAALAVVALVLPGRAAAAVRALLADRLEGFERRQERIEAAVRDEMAKGRVESGAGARELREEVRAALEGFAGNMARLAESNESRIEKMRQTVEGSLRALSEENAKRLDQMRQTVDEKLQGTLEKRLGESFRLVSERLEAVQRGLGEMQTLATGVGDLKKVLANVKVRGTWGEVQLGSLLEQMLAPDQYAANVATRRESGERVEFAVRLPGPEESAPEVLLPIDAKFPVEDYQRLVEASERGDAAAVEEASKQLEARIRSSAWDIHDKYLNPPRTTDFGILFLPTEGLYAEVVRRTGLVESLQRECKVSVAGPSTLAALLNSLQMGFRTLAIQKRSSEVWQVLGAVKAEFGKFGEVLAKVEKKLNEATNTLQDVGRRRKALERKLRDVQALPAVEAARLLPDEGPEGEPALDAVAAD